MLVKNNKGEFHIYYFNIKYIYVKFLFSINTNLFAFAELLKELYYSQLNITHIGLK